MRRRRDAGKTQPIRARLRPRPNFRASARLVKSAQPLSLHGARLFRIVIKAEAIMGRVRALLLASLASAAVAGGGNAAVGQSFWPFGQPAAPAAPAPLSGSPAPRRPPAARRRSRLFDPGRPRRQGRPEPDDAPRDRRPDRRARGHGHHQHQAAQALSVARRRPRRRIRHRRRPAGFLLEGRGRDRPQGLLAGMDAAARDAGAQPRAAAAPRRQPRQPARRARALSVPGQEGHAVPHPRHQRSEPRSATPCPRAASACSTST